MPVDSTRQEVSDRLARWELVDDAIMHEVKEVERRERYLPRPNPTDTSKENQARYENYVARAQYYNFVKRTLEGLRGTVMDTPPEQVIPQAMSYVLEDIDGNGLSLEQQTREVLGGVLTKGRYGLLASYPETDGIRDQDGFLSQELVRDRGIRGYSTTYLPRDIINWDVDRIGSTVVTVLVVLRETYNNATDEFARDLQTQYRVLKLGVIPEELREGLGVNTDQAIYYQEVWRRGQVEQRIVPRKGDGEFWERIPFHFVGSEDNSPDMDDIPLFDLADINIGHYRNSADFEESSYILGQPQLGATGMTESWIEDVWGGQAYFGSRAVLTGPSGATFTLLQAQPNSMPMEGMRYKEEVMIKLGAQLVTADSRKTATEALIDNTSDNSVLSSIAGNVSQAMQAVLRDIAEFNRINPNGVTYILNENYGAREATPEQINAWLGALSQGAMSLRTFLSNMKRGNQLPEDTTIEEEERRLQNRRDGVPENEVIDNLGDEE